MHSDVNVCSKYGRPMQLCPKSFGDCGQHNLQMKIESNPG